MPASSMITSVDGPIRGRPVRQVAVLQGPGEFGEGVGADAGLLAENGGCGSRRGEAEHLAAVLGPGHGEGTHGGGFPGAGRCDRQLQPGTRRCTSAGPAPPAQHPGRCRSPPSPAGPDPPPTRRRLTRRGVRRRQRGAARRRGSAARCRGRRRRRCRPTIRSMRRNACGSSMPSRGAARATDRRSSTSSTSRSTKALACSAGTFAVRTWRCASARTCHICQVERLFSITARM